MVIKEISNIAMRYLAEIKQDFEYSKLIIKKTGHDDVNLVKFVNSSTIISICIKYESFTSEAMFALRAQVVAYNKPWAYTRYLMHIFKLSIEDQYELAHDAWEYYNTLKHENHKSNLEKTHFVQKHNIKDSWDALQFVHRAIDDLLTSFVN